MNALGDTLGNAQGHIATLVHSLGASDLQDTDFILEKSPDGVIRKTPPLCQLRDRVMLLVVQAARGSKRLRCRRGYRWLFLITRLKGHWAQPIV